MKFPAARAALSAHIQQKADATNSSSADAKFPTNYRAAEVTRTIDKTIGHLQKQLDLLPKDAPKRGSFQEKIGKLETLRATKLHYLGPNQHGHMPFHSHCPTDILRPEPSRQLVRDSDGRYQSVLHDEAKAPVGEYAFVLRFDQPDTIFIGSGHHQLAKGKPVSYAGTIWFDEDSNIIQWQNLTGHYKTHSGFTHQTATATDDHGPLLPLDKFRARHIDQLRTHKLNETYWKNQCSPSRTAQILKADEEKLASVMKLLGVTR